MTQTARQPFQGVLQIAQYNRHLYARGIICVGIAIALAIVPALRLPMLTASAFATFWICSSLLVSYYVYDRSGLYELDWLPAMVGHSPRRWVNIHAGLDETSGRIAELFPAAERSVLDIYDPGEMTETSIAEARRVHGVVSGRADWRRLPIADGACDAAFLLFAAHELRSNDARACLLSEARRVLSTDGRLIVLEHLRNWANFVAFGPGFLHFFSARTWRSAATSGGLVVERTLTLNPFVHVFVLRRPA